MKINVYTRSVNPDNYPEGLARSIHFSCSDDRGQTTPFNRGYGILFAKGRISAENTIVPLGITEPLIFAMEDGFIGIAGKRVFENGEPDPQAEGKRILWRTKDLISFSEEESLPVEEIEKYTPSEQLDVAPETAEAALRYWSPITYTGISVPENIVIDSVRELDDIRAAVSYSDGSVRGKKILVDRSEPDPEHPGRYTITGHISQQRFRFPLANGYGDPVIFRWEGKWYYISTNDNLNDIGIYVREADTIDGLFRDGVKEHLILPFDPERGFEQTFWAPEFHVIGGELYILFAVSGHKWGPQCHMMKKKKGAPIILEDSWEDPIRVQRMDGSPLAEDAITLDMTFVRANSGSYVIWSYREHIGTALDSGSMLYIASIDEERPWCLTAEPVLLTRPLYGWENVSGTINNEGPYAFVKDNKVYVTYSGGSANRYTYALGLLTADSDADLLDIASWKKSIPPVLTFYSVKDEYGPGHNSFFENEEGELMIAYHGETDITGSLRCDGIRRVHFRKDGTPYFQMSQAEDICEEDIIMTVTISEGRPVAPWINEVAEDDFISPNPTYECGKYFDLFEKAFYDDASGTRLKYYFYDPTVHEAAEKKDYPLLVFLHGTGNSLVGDLCINYTGAEFYATPKYQNAFGGAYVLVPVANEYKGEDGRTCGYWTEEYAEPVHDLIMDFVKAHEACAGMRFLFGNSSGATFAMRLMDNYMDDFDAVMPVGSSALPSDSVLDEYDRKGKILFFAMGKKDEFHNYDEEVVPRLDRLQRMKHCFIYTPDWVRNGDKGIASINGGIEMGQHCLMNAVHINLMFDDGTPMDERLPEGVTGWIKGVLTNDGKN